MSTFFPLHGTYVVAQIDVDATLTALRDPVANAEGGKLRTTKCILYLRSIRRLPLPDHITFKYMAYVVGPGLRPTIPEWCLTSDMCTPIYPNTSHPSGTRDAVRPEPSFPFANCYHWHGRDVQVEVRVLNDGQSYAKQDRTSLSAEEHYHMDDHRIEDMRRCVSGLKAKTSEASASFSPPAAAARGGTGGSQPAALPLVLSTTGTEADENVPSRTTSVEPLGGSTTHLSSGHVCEERHGDNDQDGQSSVSSGDQWSQSSAPYGEDNSGDAQSSSSEEDAAMSLDGLYATDVFGLDFDPHEALIPIVRVWPNLTAQLKEDEIPDPVEFLNQYDDITRIVQDALTRASMDRATSTTSTRDVAVETDQSSASESADRLVQPRGRRGKFSKILRFIFPCL
ncbi:hypothetical protein GY45DRAFT_1072748 [Cubamyces sp. BRFM 1775]|nr:hypothetical protein GY45DRAFT_1072748 [Cubamyces sp. BRFM 1775]